MSMLHTVKSRPNDYYYDPSYISSGAKDYYKQGRLSKLTMTKFAVCPIFPSMFSDLQNYPRKQYVIRRPAPIPAYVDKVHESGVFASRQQILGSDRYKYFHNSPVTSQPRASVPKLDLSCFYEIDSVRKQVLQEKLASKMIKNAKVQTIYRESSAQTSPWEPDYNIVQGNPELLKLDFLKWGAGLPAGATEVEMIQRMRTKRKWEQSFPGGTDAKSFSIKRNMIEELDRSEWANRERDIEEIQELRMELLEKMLNEVHVKSKCRNEQKLRLFVDMKLREKRDKVAKIQKDAEREKRRLKFQYRGILQKYGKVNVFDEHADYKSELYCPLMRHGTNPKYGHQVLSKSTKKYQPQFYRVEEYETLPKNLEQAARIDEVKLKGRRLCIKETKWILPVLKVLYEELKELRQKEIQRPNLRVCVQQVNSLPPTPEVEISDNPDEDINEATIFLQKILRGRAAQNKIFMGRERCHVLIDELRGNYALLKGDVRKKAFSREKRKEEQLNATRCMSNMKALEGSLKKLCGSVTGTLLDFLNKDLKRLMRERRAHAMILLVERLRQIREAEEAGRRQKEIRRRKEHDEIFKQVVKVHQDTVDLYLQDVITEGMEFTSDEMAKKYVQAMAEQITKEQMELEAKEKQIEREEYVAEMVHNFVIPEVEKNIVRQRMDNQQKKYLKTAHNLIYEKLDDMPKPDAAGDSSLSVIESSSLYQQDTEAIEKIQEGERQLVMKDIQAILDDLVAVPYKLSAFNKFVPCDKEEVLEEQYAEEEEADQQCEGEDEENEDETEEPCSYTNTERFELEVQRDVVDEVENESGDEEDVGVKVTTFAPISSEED